MKKSSGQSKISMLDKKYLGEIRKKLLGYAKKRREVIKIAGDAQQLAKKAIFAFQRDDKKTGGELLQSAEKSLKSLLKAYKDEPDLFREGSYRAALEEFTEASLFAQYLTGRVIGKIDGLAIDPNTLVGGLCDVPGELYRYAIKCATARNFPEVKKCYAAAEVIIAELVDMDLTGYNRQKFDQAKQALLKLEQVQYEVSLAARQK